jgi:hypothetical protein
MLRRFRSAITGRFVSKGEASASPGTTVSEEVKVDELVDFLSNFVFIYPDLSDTFSYATADVEKIYLDDWEDPDVEWTNMRMLVRMYRKHGRAGILAYVGRMRNADPIPPLCTDAYYAAKADLGAWAYDLG